MTREHALKLQHMALAIIRSAADRDQAINDLVVRRGLSYTALRKLRTAN